MKNNELASAMKDDVRYIDRLPEELGRIEDTLSEAQKTRIRKFRTKLDMFQLPSIENTVVMFSREKDPDFIIELWETITNLIVEIKKGKVVSKKKLEDAFLFIRVLVFSSLTESSEFVKLPELNLSQEEKEKILSIVQNHSARKILYTGENNDKRYAFLSYFPEGEDKETAQKMLEQIKSKVLGLPKEKDINQLDTFMELFNEIYDSHKDGYEVKHLKSGKEILLPSASFAKILQDALIINLDNIANSVPITRELDEHQILKYKEYHSGFFAFFILILLADSPENIRTFSAGDIYKDDFFHLYLFAGNLIKELITLTDSKLYAYREGYGDEWLYYNHMRSIMITNRSDSRRLLYVAEILLGRIRDGVEIETRGLTKEKAMEILRYIVISSTLFLANWDSTTE